MAFNYVRTAGQILEMVDGGANVEGLTHCITRLRFMLKNMGLSKDSEVKRIPGVLQVIRQGGQYQVVTGNEATYVFTKLQKLGDFPDGGRVENGGPKENLFSRLCAFVADRMREYEKKSVNRDLLW